MEDGSQKQEASGKQQRTTSPFGMVVVVESVPGLGIHKEAGVVQDAFTGDTGAPPSSNKAVDAAFLTLPARAGWLDKRDGFRTGFRKGRAAYHEVFQHEECKLFVNVADRHECREQELSDEFNVSAGK